MRTLELDEHMPLRLPPGQLSDDEGAIILRDFDSRISIEFPTRKTAGQWVLCAEGWVGRFPVTPDLHLSVRPKVTIGNIFRMLEYAYNLKELEFPGLADVGELDDLFSRLALVLARRTLARVRRGLHAAYVPLNDELGYLRGTLDTRAWIRRPWRVQLPCGFEEHTRDIDDNRILAWTFWRILRGRWASADAVPTIRRAYQALAHTVTVEPVSAGACVKRLYTRLTSDYEPLHALCRFFLEHSGPAHTRGERRTLPFLLDMPRLFELFVAEWLQAHLPAPYFIEAQENVVIGEADDLRFKIDLVLYRQGQATPLAVLDTKYKKPGKPSEADISQVIAYAEAKGCSDAVLVYPSVLTPDRSVIVGNKRIQTIVFDLAGDLQVGGSRFVAGLLRGHTA